ncbi:MDIS1-interacting receptor like kinase 2-like [Prosopis cineraria]|uniref:MDIS1-interacting receptor like kinase 2-like n=1 Tax=Prosopis cineraria TaxID=364024 RepID=UPI00240FB2BB|nr:MDIS1-interacting receptor like kinase 2-like [Prosopis cineraria]
MLITSGISYILVQKSKRRKGHDGEAITLNIFSILGFDGEILCEKVVEATEDFDEKYLIGVGAQGGVYKVEILDSQIYDVKKLHPNYCNADFSNPQAFSREIQALTEIKHHNVMKLHGFYLNSCLSFLVYEFLEGGSLDKIIKNDMQASKLEWDKRVIVVRGVVDALFHMHHGLSCPIVHRDTSSKNILLDQKYQEAHINDFGIAKFLKLDLNNMTSFAGTYGYAAPVSLLCSSKAVIAPSSNSLKLFTNTSLARYNPLERRRKCSYKFVVFDVEIAFTMQANEKCDVHNFGVFPHWKS